MRETCEPISSLPPFEEPVRVHSIDIYRDGGSVEVILLDANNQNMIFHFDDRFNRPPPSGRLCFRSNTTSCERPVAQDSQAERDAARLLQAHLDSNYTSEEQRRLAALNGSKGLRDITRQEYEGYRLLRCLELLEELRKLAVFGVIERY